MTAEQVREVVRRHISAGQAITNDHRITLSELLVPPQKISVIARTVERGCVSDEMVSVWLVAQEKETNGYKIVMDDDGLQFGLASSGFLADKHPILVGWYGDLRSAFLGM